MHMFVERKIREVLTGYMINWLWSCIFDIDVLHLETLFHKKASKNLVKTFLQNQSWSLKVLKYCTKDSGIVNKKENK